MDFSLSDEQQAIRDLAGQLLTDHATPDTIRKVESAGEATYDTALWGRLAEAGLLGVNIPEEYGGLGLGFVELCQLLEHVGRTVAPVPVLATLAYAVVPLVRFGTDQQKSSLLPGVAAGDTVLTAALVEPLGEPAEPMTTARREGDGWVLDGVKTCVPAGLFAKAILVSASTVDGSTGLFLVDPTAAGVTLQRQNTISYIPEALIELSQVPAEAVGPVDADSTVLTTTIEHATAAICTVMTGVAAEAVRLTAEYTKSREQFERPIATFQAVGQRAADAYIDAQGIRLTALRAMWILSAGRPAPKEVAVAKFYAAEAGQRVARAAQHLHGGMGVDRDYPLHRYYVWAKQLELTLGGAHRQLRALGKILADEPVDAA